jgi:hypothetical protein
MMLLKWFGVNDGRPGADRHERFQAGTTEKKDKTPWPKINALSTRRRG